MNKSKEEDVYYHIQNYDTIPSQHSSTYAPITTLPFAKVKFHGVSFYCNDNYTLVSYNKQFFCVKQGMDNFICDYKKGIYCGQLRLPIPNNFLSVEIYKGKDPIFRLGDEVITVGMLRGEDKFPNISDTTETAENKSNHSIANGGENNLPVTNGTNRNKAEVKEDHVDQAIDDYDYSGVIEDDEQKEYKRCSRQVEKFLRSQDLNQEIRDIEALKNMSIEQQISCTSQSEFFQLIEISISSIVFSAAAKIGVDFIDSYNLQNPNLKIIFSTVIGWTVAYLNVPDELYKHKRKWVHFGITFGAAVFAIFDHHTEGRWTYDCILKYFIKNMVSYQEIFKVAKESFERGNQITTSHIKGLLISTIQNSSTDRPVTPVVLEDLSKAVSEQKITTTDLALRETGANETVSEPVKEPVVFQLGGHVFENMEKVEIAKPTGATVLADQLTDINSIESNKQSNNQSSASGSLDEQKKSEAEIIEEQWKQYSQNRLYAQNMASTLLSDFNKKQKEDKRM